MKQKKNNINCQKRKERKNKMKLKSMKMKKWQNIKNEEKLKRKNKK